MKCRMLNNEICNEQNTNINLLLNNNNSRMNIQRMHPSDETSKIPLQNRCKL